MALAIGCPDIAKRIVVMAVVGPPRAPVPLTLTPGFLRADALAAPLSVPRLLRADEIAAMLGADELVVVSPGVSVVVKMPVVRPGARSDAQQQSARRNRQQRPISSHFGSPLLK
jgi:hypothetical protein